MCGHLTYCNHNPSILKRILTAFNHNSLASRIPTSFGVIYCISENTTGKVSHAMKRITPSEEAILG